MRPLRTPAGASLLATLSLTCAARPAPVVTRPATAERPPAQAPVAPKPAAPARRTVADEMCQAEGYDFAYSLKKTGDMWFPICGVGPGTPCTAGHCDGERFFECHEGKLGLTDCRARCQNLGDDAGLTHDGGHCGQDQGRAACVCCDSGEPGCEDQAPAEMPTIGSPRAAPDARPVQPRLTSPNRARARAR